MGLGLFAGLALYIAGFAFFTYACIIADPKTSPTANLLTQRLPKLIGDRLTKLVGPKTVETLTKLSDYAFVVIYLFVVLGSWSIMFTYGYDFITESPHVSDYHKYAGYLVFLACMSSWRYACTTPAGTITVRNLARYDNYPYDDLLFTDRTCPTVGIRKLARSKFDRVTRRHVPRFDHFCGWVNNAVGEDNYRYFLLFLSVHVGMCWYGAIVTGMLFWGEVVDSDLYNATFFVVSSGEEVRASNVVIFHYLMARHFYLSGVFLLMVVMSLVLTAFLGFHLYITARGMTTNEYFKWRDVRKWHRNAKRRFEDAIKEGRIAAKNDDASSSGGTKIVVLDESDVGCAGPAAGDAVGQSAARREANEVEEEEIADPGPFPKNIYDRGLKENFGEVLFPRSRRNDAMERWAEALRRGDGSGNSTVSAKIEMTEAERRKPKAV